MRIPLFLVDAFTERRFCGNPAAVCLLEDGADPPASWMQSVATELNQSETAFVRRANGTIGLRWFTPTTEEELCGHATLAAAHVLWETGRAPAAERLELDTRSGRLIASRAGGFIELDFPTEPPVLGEAPDEIVRALGSEVRAYGRSRLDHMVELASEDAIRSIRPDMAALARVPGRGVVVTARSDDPAFDFVSRYFSPNDGIVEDPVTGSAHCTLAPYWAARLGRSELVGHQVSARGGVVRTRVAGPRTFLQGSAITFFRGAIE